MIFSPRNIIIAVVVAILAVAVPVTIKLTQQQQQLKSQAATTCVDQRAPDCSGDDLYCWCRGCTILQQGCTFINYQPGGWQCKSGDICSGNAVEYVPAGADCSKVTQCPAQPPAVTVNVSGKVTNSAITSQGVGGVTVALFTSDGRATSDGPTEVTASNGNYSLSATGPIVSYAVRVSNVPAGFDSNSSSTTDGKRSYESQPASGGCKNNCHFTLTPLSVGLEAATCGPVKTNNQDIRSQTLTPGKTYPVSITMNNPSKVEGVDTKEWTRDYSLRWIGSDNDKNDLSLTETRLDLGTTVKSGDSHSFPAVNITTPSRAGTFIFNWRMHNTSNQQFGGACETPIVVGGQGGPEPSPSPGAYDFELDNIRDITIAQGSTGTRDIEVTAGDSNPGSIKVDLSVSDFPSGVDGSFSSGSCSSLHKGRTCIRTLTIEVDSNARTGNRGNITVTALSNTPSGRVEREEEFDLTVSEAVTPFNFTLSTPTDITLTQGQTDSGRNINVRKTDGDAEEVSLSISGDTGGAIANFRTSPSCKPDSDCQRNLAFDTSQATPGEYFVEIQGRATSGRTKVSNPFRLTINPGAEPTSTPTPTPEPTPTPVPTPTPTPAPVRKTLCFAMGEGPEGKTAVDSITDCSSIDNKLVFPYTSEPAKINGYAFKDQTQGVKTIFVKFIGVLGTTPVFDSKQLSIRFNPNPVISSASCTHSSSGVGTDIKIVGSSLGVQGKGKIKVGSQEIIPDSWDSITNTIIGKVEQRLEGKIPIEVTLDDDRVAKGECVVNTTTVTFKTLQQCKSAGSFGASNVDIKVFEAIPLSTDIRAPEPVLRQKISLGKDGEPQNFAPKFEKNKKYQLIIKAPGTIARRVEFDTKDGGTTNIEDVISLPQGDVSPANSPDGKINALDKSELIRQWNIITDVAKSADLNGDSRVNSIDYACMRQNFNATDDTYSAPVPSPSPVASPVVSPSPSPSASATPIPTVTPSPTPGGGTGGTLFRISFDPAFTTLDKSGTVDPVTGEAIIDITLPAGPGVKNVYVQFSDDGGVTWNPIPPSVGTITLL